MARLARKILNGIQIVGFSLAGEETVVATPEYNVSFDVGRAPREIISIDNICLTHGHMDHAAGIAYYLSQRHFVGISPGRIILHRQLAQPIQKLMDIWSDIEGHPSPGQIYGIDHLEDVNIRRGLIVRPFTVLHAPGALGYTLIEIRHKLKEEYQGKSGPQLVALKKKGVEIERRVEIPLLTYTGDTAVGKWLELDFVRHSPAVLLECTFFDREHISRARLGKHIHVDDLPEIYQALPDSQIMLFHTTRRTDIRQTKRAVERVLHSNDFERTSFLMERTPNKTNNHKQVSTDRDTRRQ